MLGPLTPFSEAAQIRMIEQEAARKQQEQRQAETPPGEREKGEDISETRN